MEIQLRCYECGLKLNDEGDEVVCWVCHKTWTKTQLQEIQERLK